MREYDQIATWYCAVRNHDVGLPELTAFAHALTPRTQVLDLGCGDGIPVSQFLLQAGFVLTGVDSSPAMLARYRTNFPGTPTRCEPAQEIHFEADLFEGVVAWGVLFHLSKNEQDTVIQHVSNWLKPGGRFLFTSGDTEGMSESTMHGVTFRYISLGADAYRNLLSKAGMQVVDEHEDDWGNYIYVAQKSSINRGAILQST